MARAWQWFLIFTQETCMSISKRDFLALGAAAGASVALPAWAQAKPLFDTINMFVPAAPGGGWDGTARAIERAAKAAGLVGNMQFENVGGAGGMVGLPRFVRRHRGAFGRQDQNLERARSSDQSQPQSRLCGRR